MGERAFLGEFEHLVLAAALRLERGYGASILKDIEARSGRSVHAGSLYVTLDRLEAKGYLTTRQGKPEPERGGRPKRFVAVTGEGIQALAAQRAVLLRAWEGLEDRLGEA